MTRRASLYASLGLDPDRQGANCVAADIIAQGGSAEDAERYLRGAQWLDARFPGGYTTVGRWVGNATGTTLLSRCHVPHGSEA